MGKEKEKDKKDKDKKEKDKKHKDKKEKEKKEKDKKDKKDKEKKEKKEKYKDMPGQEWKLPISSQLDNISVAYEKISNRFKDIDNYILRDATTLEEFKEKVMKNIKDLPEETQNLFINHLNKIL